MRSIGVSWVMLLGSAAFLLAVASRMTLNDPDTYWHIATGRWILANGVVPTHDIFSFTMHGRPWVAQEWGAELILAVVYEISGWWGLTLLGAACFGLTIAYLTRFLVKRMEPLHAVVLAIFAVCMMCRYMFVLPNELAWPVMAVWIGVVIESSEKMRAPPWWLLGVMLLWANLHGSFILGLGLLVLIGAEAILNAKERWKPAARRWGAFIAAALGCAFLNPAGRRLLIFPFQLLHMHILGRLADWQPTDLLDSPIMGLWLLAALGMGFAGRLRLPFVRLVGLLALIYFALEYFRSVSLLGLISPFLIAAPLAALWRRESAPAEAAHALDAVFRALAAPGRLHALCATIVVTGGLAFAVMSVHRPRPMPFFAPRAAVNVLLARRPHARIFNDSNFGGYLIFRGIRVFVDARVTVYGDTFLRRYYGALDLNPKGNVNTLLREYRIDAVLMGPQWPVVRLLDRSPEWKRVYADKSVVAYIRRTVVRS